MNVTEITAQRRQEWNEFVANQPYFMLMQSWEWGEFKKNMGWKPYRLALEDNGKIIAGGQVLIKSMPFGIASVACVPKGPIVDWHDESATGVLLSAIHRLAARNRCVWLKIEPAEPYDAGLKQQLSALDFFESDFNNQPQCSMLIDLTADEDTILARMNKTTRYNIHYSARKGVEVREASEDDFDHYCDLMSFTSERAGFRPRAVDFYRQEWDAFSKNGHARLFLAWYDGEVLAGRMTAAFGNRAATLRSGSYDTHKKLKPNELLMWSCIQWAKNMGCGLYDVWGIPAEIGANQFRNVPLPEKQTGGLWGVYKFKRGFGGELIYYLGSYDYVYSKTLYRVMNTAMRRLASPDELAKLNDMFAYPAMTTVRSVFKP